MKRLRLFVFLFVLASLAPCAIAKGGVHGGNSSAKSSTGKSVHVHGYYRRDGTYVHGYDRSELGTASSSSSFSEPVPYRRNYVSEGYVADSSVQRDKHGRIKRSAAAKDAFKREQPCPSTGKSIGPCPGYVIDHVRSLECGGADAPGNMQWQTVSEGKAKDKGERYCR